MCWLKFWPKHSLSLLCLPPAEAIKHYGSRLSDYEIQEIEKYPEIYYLGLESGKINAKPGTPLNCGYDDENGSYNKVKILCQISKRSGCLEDNRLIFFESQPAAQWFNTFLPTFAVKTTKKLQLYLLKKLGYISCGYQFMCFVKSKKC